MNCAPRRSALAVVATLALAIASAAPVHAQWSGAQSFFTEDGVEVGVDSRVGTLFVMLNGLGYDDDTLRGPPPLRRPAHTDARQKARQNMGRPGPSLKALDAVLERNAVELGSYVTAVLELGHAPTFSDDEAGDLAKALAAPMREWFNEEGGAQVLRLVADAAKPAQRKLLAPLDESIKVMTGLVRLGDAQDQLLDDAGAQGRVVLVLNELDRHGTLQRVERPGLTYIIAGPAATAAQETAILDDVVAAYAGALVGRDIVKAIGAQTLGGDDKPYVTALVACAFTRQVRGPTSACTAPAFAARADGGEQLAVLAPRLATFAAGADTLAAALPTLLAPAPAPEATSDDKAAGRGKRGGKTGVTAPAGKGN